MCRHLLPMFLPMNRTFWPNCVATRCGSESGKLGFASVIIFPLKLGSFIVDVGCSVQTQTNFLQWCRGVDLASSMNFVVNASCTIYIPSSLGQPTFSGLHNVGLYKSPTSLCSQKLHAIKTELILLYVYFYRRKGSGSYVATMIGFRCFVIRVCFGWRNVIDQ
jgi:hypothetical protein